jgi:hypothetical protein
LVVLPADMTAGKYVHTTVLMGRSAEVRTTVRLCRTHA